jgi:hypothetical protein
LGCFVVKMHTEVGLFHKQHWNQSIQHGDW